MIRIAAIIKSQHIYNKIKQSFPRPNFEVLRNISTKQELQEFVLGDEADVAIVDDMLGWRQIAMNMLAEYNIRALLFEGDFESLEEYIKEAFIDRLETTNDGPKEPQESLEVEKVLSDPKLNETKHQESSVNVREEKKHEELSPILAAELERYRIQ